jgi:uncharacterized protein YjiS (DUF1127 family)
MLMNTISRAPAVSQSMAAPIWVTGLVATLKRWCAAYITWRIARVDFVHLNSMSDRELKDLGLNRLEIADVVTGTRGRIVPSPSE